MKIVIAFIVSLFMFQTFAGTSILVTPTFPVNCQTQAHQYVNWIYDLRKVSENDDTVIFEFNTLHGSCDNGSPSFKRIDSSLAALSFEKTGLLNIFSKSGNKVTISSSSDTQLNVRVEFDKNNIFKKKNESRFYISFVPGEIAGFHYNACNNGFCTKIPDYLTFFWDVKLVKKGKILGTELFFN